MAALNSVPRSDAQNTRELTRRSAAPAINADTTQHIRRNANGSSRLASTPSPAADAAHSLSTANHSSSATPTTARHGQAPSTSDATRAQAESLRTPCSNDLRKGWGTPPSRPRCPVPPGRSLNSLSGSRNSENTSQVQVSIVCQVQIWL